MKRYKINLQYDGGRYHGWQKQPNERMTVQETLEAALEKTAGVPISATASGRTDEGVHALGQVVHFDAEKDLPPERWRAALNHWLPEDVRVTNVAVVGSSFDARKSAKRKTYEYRFYAAETENPLRRTRELWAETDRLDVRAMDEAAKLWVGTHDLAAFMSSGSSAKTTVRTVFDAHVREERGSVIFSVTGNGFLYNTVRIMAGALLRVGRGESDGGAIAEALRTGDRRLVPDIAPPQALYLKNVEYCEETVKGGGSSAEDGKRM